MTAHGLIGAVCDPSASGTEVEILDPTTGAVQASEMVPTDFSTSIGTVATTLSCGSMLENRDALSPDLSDVAVASGNLADNSSHVGYVNLATGQFADITAATSTSTGLDATSPADAEPRFDPVSGDFWFVRNGDVIYDYNIASQTSRHATVPNDIDAQSLEKEPLTIQHGHLLIGLGMISPDGRIAATGLFVQDVYSLTSDPVVASQLFVTLRQPPQAGVDFANPGDERSANVYEGCNVISWIGTRSLLVQTNGWDGVGGLDLIRYRTNQQLPEIATVVIPRPPSRDISDPVVSPNGRTVIFEATGGSIGEWFSAPIKSMAPVTQVSLPAHLTPLGWQ